jgi:hypothetical protein
MRARSREGGGHGVAGNAVCDSGLMIDPARMRSTRVDPGARIVRTEPGVLGPSSTARRKPSVWRRRSGHRLDHRHRRLTLSGRQSWLGSKHGFAVDNLLSVDIVIADGKLRTASAIRTRISLTATCNNLIIRLAGPTRSITSAISPGRESLLRYGNQTWRPPRTSMTSEMRARTAPAAPTAMITRG